MTPLLEAVLAKVSKQEADLDVDLPKNPLSTPRTDILDVN